MRTSKLYSALGVQVMGWMVLSIGVVSTANDYYTRFELSFPQNMGIVLGNSAIVLLGVVALVIAACLKNVEQRLDRMEKLNLTKFDKQT